MGKLFSFILALAITVGAGAGGFYFGAKEAKKDVAQISDLGQIVDIDDEEGFLTESQSAMLNRGAPLRFGDEVYQLSKSGAETVYTYSDSNDYFIRKYITINVAERTYTRRVEINSDYIDKDTLSAALTEYMKSAEVQRLLNSTLTSYVKNAELTGVVKMYYTSGTLQFKPNTMYAVQCLDSSLNLADFSIIGGSKDGKTGRFALVFVGDKVSESLVLYQTGSVVLSNLAATSGGSTGIKPAASSSQLRYFVIGGKVKG